MSQAKLAPTAQKDKTSSNSHHQYASSKRGHSSQHHSSQKENKHNGVLDKSIKVKNGTSNTNNQKQQIDLDNRMLSNTQRMPMMVPNQHNVYYQEPSKPKPDLAMIFRQQLSQVTNPDRNRIEDLTNLARLNHSENNSNKVVEYLVEQILNSEHSQTFMCILDSILKNVQGDYIKLFEEHISKLFQDTFNKAASMNEKKNLIKMFKIWDLFFDPALLEQISQTLQLPEYEKRLFSTTDYQKVENFKKVFEPCSLPEEVLRNGLYITGSETNNSNIEQSFDQRKRSQQPPQFTNPPSGYGQMGMENFGRRQVEGGLMGPPAVLQQHPQMPGHTNLQSQTNIFPQKLSQTNHSSYNTYHGGAANVGGPSTVGSMAGGPPQTSQSTVTNLLEQLSKINSSQQNPQLTQRPPNDYSQQQQQQQFPSYPQQPQTSRYPQQQNAGGRTSGSSMNGQYGQHGMMSGNAGGASGSGQVYASVDNFPHQQQTVDHRQIGFLPSILKSFYHFKQNQQYLLGQDPNLARLHQHGKCKPPTFRELHSLKEFNVMAIAEIYEGVKFQCSNCGMRFIRNLTLKKHLDMHFSKNNDFRKRGNRAVSRPQFMSGRDFVQPKSSLANQRNAKGGPGASGQMNVEDMVPYSNKDAYCFICKEKFEVIQDEDEEQWFFVGAKKIRMTVTQGKKSIVNVHSECLKQIEMNRDVQKQLRESQDNPLTEEKLVPEEVQEPKLLEVVEESDERLPIEVLERQIRGFVQSKRQFLGK